MTSEKADMSEHLFGGALAVAACTAGDGRQQGAWYVGGKSKGKRKCDGNDLSKGKEKGGKGKSQVDDHYPSKGKEKGGNGKSKGDDDYDPSNGKEKGGKGESKGDDHDQSRGKEKGEGKSKRDDHDPIIDIEAEGKGNVGKGKFDYNELCNKVWWLEKAMRNYSNNIEELKTRIDNAETELARFRALLFDDGW